MLQVVPSLFSTMFIVLFVVWLVLYITGMIFGKLNEERTRKLPQWGRFGMVAVVLAYGLIWWLGVSRGTDANRYAMWIFLGLVGGAFGDFFLSGIQSLKKPVISGILSFSVGHIFYLFALFTLRAKLGHQEATPLIIAIVIGLVLACMIWVIMVRNPNISPALNYGSLAYAMLLVTTTTIAVELSLATGQMWALSIGLILFTISDITLAQILIRKTGFPYIRDVVWIVYSSAQTIIAFSVGTVLALTTL